MRESRSGSVYRKLLEFNRDLGRYQLLTLLQRGIAVAETVLEFGLEMASETIT